MDVLPGHCESTYTVKRSWPKGHPAKPRGASRYLHHSGGQRKCPKAKVPFPQNPGLLSPHCSLCDFSLSIPTDVIIPVPCQSYPSDPPPNLCGIFLLPKLVSQWLKSPGVKAYLSSCLSHLNWSQTSIYSTSSQSFHYAIRPWHMQHEKQPICSPADPVLCWLQPSWPAVLLASAWKCCPCPLHPPPNLHLLPTLTLVPSSTLVFPGHKLQETLYKYTLIYLYILCIILYMYKFSKIYIFKLFYWKHVMAEYKINFLRF